MSRITMRTAVRTLALAVVPLGGLLAAAPGAQAIEFRHVGGWAHEAGEAPYPMAIAPIGAPVRQAGAHPDVTFEFSLPGRTSNPDELLPVEQPHRVVVDLPPGLIGNPQATTARCPERLLKAGLDGLWSLCPTESQIGTVALRGVEGLESTGTGDSYPVYNLEPRAGQPAQFAFLVIGNIVRLTPSVRPGDFGISVDSGITSQGLPIPRVRLTMWGVPYDPIHDNQRYRELPGFGLAFPPASVPGDRKAFLSLPTRCDGTPDRTVARIDGWESIGQFATGTFTNDLDGIPFVNTGCEKVPFDASLDVAPTSRTADAPTGLDVDLRVPQSTDPDILATSHVKDVSMVLPEGMSVAPGSAAGLGACSLAQINLDSNDAPSCPRSSKLGTVSVETPLLEEPMSGDVILATPDSNPFGSLVALYLAVKGPGVMLKIPGRVDPDPVTGRLTATFANNPQLPFSRLRVRFDGGENASLATPAACGRYETKTTITSWSGKSVSLSSPMVVDQGCGPRGFDPTVSAGSASPLAAQDSAFTMSVDRPDRQQTLSQIGGVMPPGLLARVGDVPLCDDAAANAGTCSPASRVGSVRTTAGPGSAPLPVTGQVFLTGPYKGGPYGLSIVVPTAGQAGPFDLGNVIVRARIDVDRTDAHVSVQADPMPTILRGFPLRVRTVQVLIDRERFMINPSSCRPLDVGVRVTSTDGGVREQKVPYRVSGCGDLDQDQKLSIGFTNKTQTRPGKHPGVQAKLSSKGPGGANLKKVVVKLPLSVALDPQNAKALCKPEQREAKKCPADSIVGRATATSVLKEPLAGPVYFVEGTRKTKAGKVVPTLPKLWIPLSGGGVTIDVNADSGVSRRQLVSTFHDLPDAPITSFVLRLDGGKHGILTIPPNKAGGTCQRDKTVQIQLTGHNGAVKTVRSKVAVAGCRKAKAKAPKAKGRTTAVRASARRSSR